LRKRKDIRTMRGKKVLFSQGEDFGKVSIESSLIQKIGSKSKSIIKKERSIRDWGGGSSGRETHKGSLGERSV